MVIDLLSVDLNCSMETENCVNVIRLRYHCSKDNYNNNNNTRTLCAAHANTITMKLLTLFEINRLTKPERVVKELAPN